MDLYTKYANDFSKTRVLPWSGWNKVQKFLKEDISILDIGCGNGRFLEFATKKLDKFSYIGIDNSTELLKIAKERYPKRIFINVDLEDNWTEVLDRKGYDLIVVFGVLHHIKSFRTRAELIKVLGSFLEKEGVLILTWWRFYEFEKYKKKLRKLNVRYNSDDFSNMDFYMSFGSYATRFCHYATQQEIDLIIKNSNLSLVESFYDDGRNDRENLYTVLKNDAPK